MSITMVPERIRCWGAGLGAFLLVSPAWSEAARLHVETADGARRVWVNGEFAGFAPVTVDSLVAGSIDIAIGEADSSSVWVLPWTTHLEVVESDPRTLSVPPLQRLRVQTPPISTQLEMDGTVVGSTPLQLLIPSDRDAELAIRGEGLEPQSFTYRPGGRPDSTLRVSLSIEGSGSSHRKGPGKAGWFSRSATLLPIGAVLAGVAGVWSRQTADRAYDNYLDTIDRGEMRKHLDRANQYDEYAVGFWIAAEVLLAASAWTWLRAGLNDDEGDLPDEGHIGVSIDELLRGNEP